MTVENLEITGATNGVNVSDVSGTVTLQGLTLTANSTGLTASGDTALDLTALTLTSNTTAGGTIGSVTTVTETPSSGSTPTNVTVSGSSFQNDTNQTISLSSITNFIVYGSTGSDTFTVTPSITTTFTIHGGLPNPPVSPGDTLNVLDTTDGTLTATDGPTGYSGMWTFTGGKPVNEPVIFDGIETLNPPLAPSTTYAVADFPGVDLASGESSVWLYTNTGMAASSGWSQLPDPSGVTVAPTLLAVDASGYVAAEFPGSGVWLYNGTSWTKLTTATASLLAMDNSGNVYADLSVLSRASTS